MTGSSRWSVRPAWGTKGNVTAPSPWRSFAGWGNRSGRFVLRLVMSNAGWRGCAEPWLKPERLCWRQSRSSRPPRSPTFNCRIAWLNWRKSRTTCWSARYRPWGYLIPSIASRRLRWPSRTSLGPMLLWPSRLTGRICCESLVISLNKVRGKVLLWFLSVFRVLIFFLVNQVIVLVLDQFMFYNVIDFV